MQTLQTLLAVAQITLFAAFLYNVVRLIISLNTKTK
jgi:hypothetical protein